MLMYYWLTTGSTQCEEGQRSFGLAMYHQHGNMEHSTTKKTVFLLAGCPSVAEKKKRCQHTQ